MSIKTEILEIEGMSCNHCVSSVTNALNATQGVTVESVEIGQATVAVDTEVAKKETIVAAIEEIGFDVKV